MRYTLLALLKENNMTYQDVADKVGISKEFFWQIANGKRKLSYELAVRISLVFNKTPDEIFLQEELTKSELVN